MVRKWLLIALLVLVLTVIITTWGSIGSAVLSLALLLAGGFLLTKRLMETHDPDDMDWVE